MQRGNVGVFHNVVDTKTFPFEHSYPTFGFFAVHVRLWKRHECDSFHVFTMTVAATVLRPNHFSPSWQTFTALETGKSTETATKQAHCMVCDCCLTRILSDSALIAAQARRLYLVQRGNREQRCTSYNTH